MSSDKKTNKGKKYDKPLSLYPMKVENAIKKLLNVKPKPKKEEPDIQMSMF